MLNNPKKRKETNSYGNVMEKYEKPDMEIVELVNEIIMSSLCETAQEMEAVADTDCNNDIF